MHLLCLKVYENIASKRKFSPYSSADRGLLCAKFQDQGNKDIPAILGKAFMCSFGLPN
jgi:hypothetical protein